MSKDISENVVNIQILGKEYSIRSSDRERVLAVASHLDEEMNKLKMTSPAFNIIDLSVMTAFKAFYDYFSLREEFDRLQRRVQSEVDELSARIDQNLTGA